MRISKTFIHTSLLVLCLAVLGSVSGSVFIPGIAKVKADDKKPPVCVVLGQGEKACPTLDQGVDKKGVPFPATANTCYYYDPSNPAAGSIKNFPGWQKSSCDSDIFKEGLCSPDKIAKNPQCQYVGTTDDTKTCTNPDGTANTRCDLTKVYVVPLINIMAALVGIIVTGSIIYGGIQYASSADDPQKVSQAKSRITNSLIALASFFFLYAFIQWLIPGGIFK